MADYPYATLDRRIAFFLACFLALYTLDIAVAHIVSDPSVVQAITDTFLLSRLRGNSVLNILIRPLFGSTALVLQRAVRRIIVLVPYVLAIYSILKRYQLSLARPDDPPTHTQKKILEDSGRQTYTARKALEMSLEDHDTAGFPDVYPTAHPADSAHNRMLQRFQRRTSIGPSPLAVSKTPGQEETEMTLRVDPSAALRLSTGSPVSNPDLGTQALPKEDESAFSDLSGDETPKTPRPSQEAFKHLVGTLNSMFRSVLAPEYISPRRDTHASDSDEEPDYDKPRHTEITSGKLKAAVHEAYPGKEIDVSQLSRAVRQALPNIEYCRRLKVLYQQKKHEADDLLRKNESLRRWMSETTKQNRKIYEELSLTRQRLADAGVILPQIDMAQFQNNSEEFVTNSHMRGESINASSPIALSPGKEIFEERLSYVEAKNQNQMKIIQKQGSRIHDLTIGIELLEEDNRRLRKLREDLYDEITELEERNEDLKEQLQNKASDASTKGKGLLGEADGLKEEELETVSKIDGSSDPRNVSAKDNEHTKTPTMNVEPEEHNSLPESGVNSHVNEVALLHAKDAELKQDQGQSTAVKSYPEDKNISDSSSNKGKAGLVDPGAHHSSDLQAKYDNETQRWIELVQKMEERLTRRTKERDMQVAYAAELEEKLQRMEKAQASSEAFATVNEQDAKLETHSNTSRESERNLKKTRQDALAELDTCRKRCRSLETELDISRRTAKQLYAKANAEVKAMKDGQTAKKSRSDKEPLSPQEAQYNDRQNVVLPELNTITGQKDIDADKLDQAAADLRALREENRMLIETVIKKNERIGDLEDKTSSLVAAPEREPPSLTEAEIEIADLKTQLRKLQSIYDNYRKSTARIIADCKNHSAEIVQLKKANEARPQSGSSAPRKTIYVYHDPQTGEKFRTTEPNSEGAKEFRREIEAGRMVTQFLHEEYIRQRNSHNEMVAETARIRDFYERLKDRHLGRLIQHRRLIERFNELLNLVNLRLMPLLAGYRRYHDMREAADLEIEKEQMSREREA